MGNRFYVAGQRRAAQVNDLFSAIASRYDLINDLQSFGLHRHWKRLLFRRACVQPQDRVLDLCCGTGDVALGLRPSGAKIVGLDFSAPMLAVAQQRSLRMQSLCQPRGAGGSNTTAGQAGRPDFDLRNRPAVLFLQGDATKIPFIDSQFDVVTISYG
ncbi:MAG: class I SAM-dependent methyltransferase, partial [Chloroflexi bacterium]|nr:class I SAM-dependent methyltransferase [Chloroflexota bacterium]